MAIKEFILNKHDDMLPVVSIHNGLTYVMDKLQLTEVMLFPEDYDEMYEDFASSHNNIPFKIDSYFRKLGVSAFHKDRFSIEFQTELWNKNETALLIIGYYLLEYYIIVINLRIVCPYWDLKFTVIYPYENQLRWSKMISADKKPKLREEATDEKLSTFGFYYPKINTDKELFSDFLGSLKKGGFICQRTKPGVFKAIFNNARIEEPVQWLTGKCDLNSFISLLHNEYKVIQNCKQKQWKIASACFVDAEGRRFSASTLRPANKRTANFIKIDKIAKMLK